jgi:protein-arginine kinase activator protein McsA
VNKSKEKDMLCNKCGESCKVYIDAAHTKHVFNHALIVPKFGYPSLLFDGDVWEVHICEECYTEFENTFKIKPEKQTNLWGNLI